MRQFVSFQGSMHAMQKFGREKRESDRNWIRDIQIKFLGLEWKP